MLALAKNHNADVSRAEIVDPVAAADLPDMVRLLVSLRGDKGMSEAAARDLLHTDFNWSKPAADASPRTPHPPSSPSPLTTASVPGTEAGISVFLSNFPSVRASVRPPIHLCLSISVCPSLSVHLFLSNSVCP